MDQVETPSEVHEARTTIDYIGSIDGPPAPILGQHRSYWWLVFVLVGVLLVLGLASGWLPRLAKHLTSRSPAVAADVQPVASSGQIYDPAAAVASTGHWVAQLSSAPTSVSNQTLQRTLSEIRSSIPTAAVLRSDDFASIQPGYWVIFAGPFDTPRSALQFCAGHGRTTARDCFARVLSHDPRDRNRVARP